MLAAQIRGEQEPVFPENKKDPNKVQTEEQST